MNAPSPVSASGSLATYLIEVDGAKIDSSIQVATIETWSAVNRVPHARLTIYDGKPASADFPISAGETFLPGKTIEILLGYDELDASVFKGVIVKQSLEIDRYRASRLIVDAYDKALSMTLSRNSAVFTNKRDDEIIKQLVGGHAGLRASVTATKGVQEQLVQYYASDWDMMLTRAEANGMVVIVDAGEVEVAAPKTSGAPALRVHFGDAILDLRVDLDASTQLDPKAITSYAWDPSTQKLLSATPGSVQVEELGDLSSTRLSEVFAVPLAPQQSAGALDSTALSSWSSAELLKSKLAKIRGTLTFKGSAALSVGETVDLGGLGARFNGDAWISGVTHRISEGAWTTEAELGLAPDWFAATTSDLAAPEAAGLLPPITGLQTGVVKQVSDDPANELRVLVSVPLLRAGAKAVWARLAGLYASSGFGALFYPEVGDEVVLGFMGDDPRHPIVLGSVYSKQRKPQNAPDARNTKKELVTRTKLALRFDETDKSITVETPGGHRLVLDDKTKKISITDSNRNSIVTSPKGIAIESASSISIKAKTSATIEALSVSIKATTDAALQGLNTTVKGSAKLGLRGALTELAASSINTIRGALVKIN